MAKIISTRILTGTNTIIGTETGKPSDGIITVGEITTDFTIRMHTGTINIIITIITTDM